ncbi:GNAT family N-acetyltransferase [Tsukamurella sp. 8F]|uniref:GNAT family N-acetyltransferase n=1 Tax=unclassified Tsukamurella TaxID=2633480 RepID=UPI0023B8AF3B|nr:MULTISPECIES: GNAT family N-acetyltransferase [unclassified Tsukamurella]MDF0528336.1 GNAT family N-acetyltransferase [Tsukamurella sp. 8J]MDF0586161.1 GNAT family N-acetyltransferase [Tsukamurella sp. 8F]
MEIRDATENDLPAILAIYNDAVADSTAIWTDERSDLAGRHRWLEERTAAGFPVLVAIVDDAVAGYATFGPYRAKSGYRHTVENSVYVSENFYRRGIAEALMRALIERAEASDVHVIVAAIEASNLASVALHRKLEFRVVGQMPEVGVKFGRWLDLVLMQRIL